MIHVAKYLRILYAREREAMEAIERAEKQLTLIWDQDNRAQVKKAFKRAQNQYRKSMTKLMEVMN